MIRRIAVITDVHANLPALEAALAAIDALGLPPNAPEWMSDGEWRHHEWVHAQLSADHRSAVARWPWSVSDDTQGARLLFMHYGQPDGLGGFASIVREPSGSDLDDVFRAPSADLVFYGHHHPRSDLTGNARYINPGSLGCHVEPVARFAVLEVDRDGAVNVSFHQEPYDPTPLLRALETRDVPDRKLIRQAFLRFG